MKSPSQRQSDSHESGLVQRLRRSLLHIPTDRPHVLLACSGGKDSVALASALAMLAGIDVLTLTLAHIHHGQHHRADEAATAVEKIGNKLALQVVVRHLVPEVISGYIGVGLEESLRRERYLALLEIAQESAADCIALAHHQSDQAETLLLHLIRGSGVDGLAGMKEWELRQIPWWKSSGNKPVGIWRPFLHESAETVAAIALRSGLPIVEDPTNTDAAFRRNAIRHEALPILERIAPGSTAAIARSAEVVAVDAALLADETLTYLAICAADGGLKRQELVSLPGGWQLRVVRAWLSDFRLSSDLTYDRILAVVEMAQRNRGGSRVQLGGGVDVVLTRGVLELETWQNNGNDE